MMERVCLEYVVNALWQIPLLAGGAWFLLRITTPPPQSQHRVWLGTLALAVLLPVVGIAHSDRTQPPAGSLSRVVAPHEYAVELSPRVHSVRLSETATHWLVRLYLATVSLGFFRIAHAWFASRRLVERSRKTAFRGQTLLDFQYYGQRLGITLPRLRESAEVSSPMVLGAARPILLLPEDFTRFTENEVRAALCHELAHVRRRDYVGNLICQLAALPVVWHPAVSAIQHRIRITRELLCDAMAAQQMETRLGYAKCLLTLAHGMTAGLDLAEHTQFQRLFSSNSLEERVMRLMETTTMSVRVKVARITSGAAVLILTASLAAMFHVIPTMAASRTQPVEQTSQSAPPAAATAPVLPIQEPPAATAPAAKGDEAETLAPVQADTVDTLAPVQAEQTRSETDSGRQTQDSPLVSPEFKREIAAAREQAAKAKAIANSPEFKRQIKEAQEQAARARAMIDNPEFKRQIESAQAQARAITESPEFKRAVEEAQHVADQAREIANSPEFKREVEEAKRQADQAKAIANSPEFKRQIREAQQQAARARAMMDNPEFKRQIEEAQQEAIKAKTMLDSPEFKQQIEDAKRSATEAMRQFDEDSARDRKTKPE